MTDSDAIFDGLSSDYDSSFTRTSLGQYYRARVQRHMQEYWPRDKKILEINAGTGEDALFLAGLGNHILATDQSINMIKVAKEKAEEHNCLDKIQFQLLAIEDLKCLFGQAFDGLLSNFGGLNCIEDIQDFARIASSFIKTDGIVILCIMGPFVPWEWAWYCVRGQFSKAFRRLSGKTQWQGATIYYPTPAKVKRLMKEASFECIDQEALGILMPPTYACKTFENWPKLFGVLSSIEKNISKALAASYLADHYVLVFERSDSDKKNV